MGTAPDLFHLLPLKKKTMINVDQAFFYVIEVLALKCYQTPEIQRLRERLIDEQNQATVLISQQYIAEQNSQKND